MAGFKVPTSGFSKRCEVCGKVVEGSDATDLMIRYRAHILGHRGAGGPVPDPRLVDRFK